jgi:hypothetical protein
MSIHRKAEVPAPQHEQGLSSGTHVPHHALPWWGTLSFL